MPWAFAAAVTVAKVPKGVTTVVQTADRKFQLVLA